MKRIYIYSILISLCCTSSIFSQSYDTNFFFERYNSIIFQTNNDALNNKTNSFNNRTPGILIQQIGEYNASSITVTSKETSISLTQNGDNNDYLLVKNAAKIKANVIQNGNSNSINDYTRATNYDTNSQMIQNGNNLNIKSIGTNSISKDMKVNQVGNGASIIIINKTN